MGYHAPGLRDIRAAAHAMHHSLLAHGRSIQVMRSLGMDNLGVVMNFEYAEPAGDSDEASAAARLYDGIYNRWFLGGVFHKAYPEDVLDGLLQYMPGNFAADFETIAEPVDWLGINYYTRKLIAPDDTGLFPGYRESEGPLPKTTMDWEIYPQGLHHFITWADREYTKGLPIYVTENGMASADFISDDAVADPDRISYINRHLDAVRRAIAEGAPVRGYFIWSLLDNYEWTLGYDQRFGLVHVDFQTQKRTPKQSFEALASSLNDR
jgi:beta-glucosidase